VIHSDFEKGFIRAEIVKFTELASLGSELAVREAGLHHVEGKEYAMEEGDIARFRFNA
jgi:ribosome-binding ATPase YchF (GTP1/OBG family)